MPLRQTGREDTATTAWLYAYLLGCPSLPRVGVEQPNHEVREYSSRLLFLGGLGRIAAARAPAVAPRQRVGLDDVRDVAVLEVLLQLGHRRARVSRVLLGRF